MTALYRQQKLADFEKKQVSGRIENIRGNLEKFAKETGDWLEDEQRGKILAAAINLSGGTADLAAVKELIDGVEVAAVERYKAQLKAEAENKAQIGKLKSPAGGAEVVNNHENNDDWHLLDAEAMNREVLKFYEEKSKCL